MRFVCALVVLCFSLTAFSQTRVRENIKQMTYTDSQTTSSPSAEQSSGPSDKKVEPRKKPTPKK